MKKVMVLAMLLSIVPVFASAQAPMAHVHPKIKVTDGATNPELIPDSKAYLLYLLSASTKSNPTVEESRYQSLVLSHLALDSIDQIRLLGILRDFRDRHDVLVTRFNVYATAAQARGEVVDNTLFLQQLDDLTTSIRTNIQGLTGAASSSIEGKVQEFKKRIKHVESEGAQQ